MHEGDHPALEFLPPKTSKLNHLVAALRKELILRSKTVSVSNSVPQWNETPGSRIQILFRRRIGDALCDNMRSHSLDTPPHSVQT